MDTTAKYKSQIHVALVRKLIEMVELFTIVLFVIKRSGKLRYQLMILGQINFTLI
jgi:hypothetical protein